MNNIFALFFVFLFIPNMAMASNVFFSCTAKSGEIIKVYENKNKFRVSIDNLVIDSRDSIDGMGEDIVKNDPDNNSYMEFNAINYYITVGSPNNVKGDELLTIASLTGGMPDGKLEKKYHCLNDYQNNISKLVDNYLDNQ